LGERAAAGLFRADEHEATATQLTPASVGNVHLAARVAATAGKLLESGAWAVRAQTPELGLAGEEEQEEQVHRFTDLASARSRSRKGSGVSAR
jgi:hypothetical protein